MTELQETTPEITIAFLNYNTAEKLLRALESVDAAAEGVQAHVVVIDNGSTDDSIERIRACNSSLDILELPRNVGFAAGFNRLFSYVVTPYYLLVNSDIILPPGCVKQMLERFSQCPSAGLAGVALVRADGSPQSSYGVYPSLASELLNRSLWQRIRRPTAAGDEPISVDCIVGAVMLVPRETIETVGGMDERFFFFLEETDWCRRIRNAGLDVIHLPDVRVTHLQGEAANKSPLRARIEFHCSRLLYFRKHHGALVETVLRLGTVVRLVVNLVAQLVLCIVTLGLMPKPRQKLCLYAGLLGWYLCGCPRSWGLGGREQMTNGK